MGRPVNNAVLAEKIDAMLKLSDTRDKRSDERHLENVTRMDEIRTDVKDIRVETKLTNGRLSKAETKIAIHQWALGIIGAGLLVWAGAWLSKVL